MQRVLFFLGLVLALAQPLHADEGLWTTTYPFGGSILPAGLTTYGGGDDVLLAAPRFRGVFRTFNGGRNWNSLTDSRASELDALNVHAIATSDGGGSIYVLAGGPERVNLFYIFNVDSTSQPSGPDTAADFSALAVDPAAGQIVYLGSTDGIVYKSVDNATSWSSSGTGLPADAVRWLSVDPSSSGTVYLGTRNHGVYKSADGGESWAPANGSAELTTIDAIVIGRDDPRRLYVLDRDLETHTGRVFRSSDGGASWSELSVELELDDTFGELPGALLAIDHGNSDVVYAVSNGAILKTTDAGETWTRLPVEAGVQLTAVVINSADSATLYTAGTGENLYKSLDGGATWRTINQGLNALSTPHLFAKSLAADASRPEVIYAGSIRGGFRSSDGGLTWAKIDVPYLLRSFATHPEAPGVVYGFGSDLLRSDDYGVTWQEWNNGAFCCFTDGDVVIDPEDPQTLLLAGAGSQSSPDGLYESIDGGLTWTRLAGVLPHDALHTLTFAPNALYAGTAIDAGAASGVFKSTDGGVSWTRLAGGLPAEVNPGQIAVHPLDPDLVFMATFSTGTTGTSGLYRSRNGGATWTEVLEANVFSVAVDPTDPARVYAAGWGDSGFYRSLDGGATWRPVTAGLPAQPGAEAILVDPSEPARLLLGSAAGVYEIVLGPEVTIMVRNGGDTGPGSFREALERANLDGTPSRIIFSPNMGGALLLPKSPLPVLTEGGTVIQADMDNDCLPDLGINGMRAGATDGLVITSADNAVYGLAIYNFENDGILITGAGADRNTIGCSYLGGDLRHPSGPGNGASGIRIQDGAEDNLVGGNVIAGNGTVVDHVGAVAVRDGLAEGYPGFSGLTPDFIGTFAQLDFTSGGPCGFFHPVGGATITDGNGAPFLEHFGARFTGTLSLGTAGSYTFDLSQVDEAARLRLDGAVVLDVAASSTARSVSLALAAGDHDLELDYLHRDFQARLRLDVTGPGSATFTSGGLSAELFRLRRASERNRIVSNEIYGNGGPGIALGVCGAGDPDPGDADVGPNTLLNAPRFASFTVTGRERVSLTGTAPPDSEVSIFAASVDDDGYAEPRKWLQSEIADRTGGFRVEVDLPNEFPAVTAFAVDRTGNTSELSPPFAVGCSTDDQAFCLNHRRFLVEVEWRDFNGGTGFGRPVEGVTSADSGLFWFFSPDNWEMLVKVLDGCGINRHFWVFASATTTVEYTLRVTDTATGLTRSYFNPLGNAAAAITDTAAFMTCTDP